MFIIHKFSKLLEDKPIITKCCASFVTSAVGDLICQSINSKTDYFDFKRTFLQASFSFIAAPYSHFQINKVVPYLFPKKTKLDIIKSVLYNQFIVAPPSVVFFFFYIAYFNGKNYEESKANVKAKFMPTMIMGSAYWPIIWYINFSYVPSQWRVLFGNFCGIFWSVYLSYVQNHKLKNMI